MVTELSLGALFFVSVFLLPWWMTLALAVLFVSLFKSGPIVILGGFIMDSAFGTPFFPLFGFHYIFTSVLILVSITAFYLRSALSE